MVFLPRLKSESAVYPIKCELASPDRISELCPLLRTDDLVGGLWVPGDGVGNPYEICRALAALSAEMGVKVIQVIFRNMSGHASQLLPSMHLYKKLQEF